MSASLLVITVWYFFVSISFTVFPFKSTTLFTSFGCIIVPSFAIVLATNAICIGVARISLWPIPLCAISPFSYDLKVGNTLCDIESPVAGISLLNPNFSAVSFNLSFPSSSARLPKTTLLDLINAVFKSILPLVTFFTFGSVNPPPRSNTPLSSNILDCIPEIFCNALVVVTVLKVDPGGYLPLSVLFIRALLESLPELAASIALSRLLGSYVGIETSANISPVLGFIATAAPLYPPKFFSPLYAACWILGSNVVTIPFPILFSSLFLSLNISFNESTLKFLIKSL